MILEGTLKSDERLPTECTLAERLEVSQPSLREAIRRLVTRGLLVSRQGGGNYVIESLGATFSDPLLHLLEGNPEAQRDLLKFRHTLGGSCAYYTALHTTSLDHQRLAEAFGALQACYTHNDQVSVERGAAGARFHLTIAEASHNAMLLYTIKDLFNLPRRNVVTSVGGMYTQRAETRTQPMEQHQRLYGAIISDQAELARKASNQRIHYVQEVLAEVQEEACRIKHSQYRRSMRGD